MKPGRGAKDACRSASGLAYRFLDKGGTEFIIPAHPASAKATLAYMKAAEITDGWLWRRHRGRSKHLTDQPIQPATVNQIIKQRCKALGLPHITPHQFRKTGGTELRAKGMSLPDLQAWLGHADLSTTRLYDDTEQQIAHDAISLLDV